MTEAFDPYHKWLGIPPQDQPPHHYRLLGIELFESDPDVISNAVDGRMAQVKCFQTGAYSAVSQRLLNEIALAKVCLLNPNKKPLYDDYLRKELAERANAGRAAVPPPPPVAEDDFVGRLPEPHATSNALYHGHGKRRRSNRLVWAMLAVGIVAVIPIVYLLAQKDKASPYVRLSSLTPEDTDTADEGHKSNESQAGKPDVRTDDSQASPYVRLSSLTPEDTDTADEGHQSNESQAGKPDVPVAGEPMLPLEVREAEPLGEAPPVVEPVIEESPEEVEPAPVMPSDEAIGQAEARIQEVFKAELADTGDAKKMLALAARLREQAATTEDDPAVRYALLELAATLSARAGDPDAAFDAVDLISASFGVDPFAMKADMLATAIAELPSGTPPTSAATEVLVRAAVELADAAGDDNEYEVAARVIRLAQGVARKAKDPPLQRELTGRIREVERSKAAYATMQKAQAELATNADRADANGTVGRWYCLLKGDWSRGLPYLAKGDDAGLAALAQRDLATPREAGNAPEVHSQYATAEQWWTAGETQQPRTKAAMDSRAVYWYERALPGLSGLEKTNAQKRIAAADNVVRVKNNRGVIQPGNVALASNKTRVSGSVRQPQRLIDGVTTSTYQGFDGVTYGTWPCEWIITFDKAYRLREMRFRLWDNDKRYYNYAIAVSADGQEFSPLVDRSQGAWSSWQRIQFPAQPVKAVKLIGLANSANKYFSIIEFEAYCIPPRSAR